ncbi:MAG: hypothetical protein O2895_01850 [Chloroflexi bacterium]|nr:hypothetical protein [Chloroflexota bacterium]
METLDFFALTRGDALLAIPVLLDAADTRAYLTATGEPLERWTEAAPPLAIGALVLAALTERIPLPEGTVHIGQEFEFLRTVTPGEPLQVDLRIGQRSDRSGAVVIAFDLALHTAAGDAVLRGRATVVAPARATATPS